MIHQNDRIKNDSNKRKEKEKKCGRAMEIKYQCVHNTYIILFYNKIEKINFRYKY